MDEMLTVDEVAARLRISRWTVYRLIKERRLDSGKVGACRRITATSVAAYIAAVIEEAA
ncbi:MAG: helix-turn-helix domain-containing protein [Acidothermales bacterium]|nr:helix-turn-helix domain-containing protein [Acidothermales bacterium]